jgi:polyphosphate kinase 2 (PPK2 family)
MLVDAGIHLTKFWFSVTSASSAPGSRSARSTRCVSGSSPRWTWRSLDRWEAYTAAKEAMFERTDTDPRPWITIKSNDKKRARLNAMRAFLNQFDYEGKDPMASSAASSPPSSRRSCSTR